ncbi:MULTISPECIES: hypothetical protein [Streptomyces]|uniref:Uncharacterized protein n=1 Tax=Streptomyces nodosus TaxID=40318 RepID=A0A0B5DNJ8_9ACTN|nr:MULTISPECIES: hypothetical protein [Streptomyces]AJE42875.1 hypothetical protein SNOD_24640 [Streptomyces nodosus]MBB4794221.1 hypothetical protein [Streptomyces nodosus]MYV48246.1 hypothetical protein [Streptomyces sp. SID2888]QEV41373.1 hypothetical protein CP978_24970 [Streptomyces nodosus]
MDLQVATKWETAVLAGGPADGLRMQVADRPSVLQVTVPCRTDGPTGEVRVEALYIYRRQLGVHSEPLSYGYDSASP